MYATFKFFDSDFLEEAREGSIAVKVDTIFAVKAITNPHQCDGNKSIIYTLTHGDPYSFPVAADVTEVLATIELADPTKLMAEVK